MRTQLKIKLTEDDIYNGDVGQPNSCAIALHINRAYPQYQRVQVTEAVIAMTDPKERTRYKWVTPMSARKFIKAFDAGVAVPGDLSFTLRKEEALATPAGSRQTPEESRKRTVAYKSKIESETPEQRSIRIEKAEKRRENSRTGKTFK